MLLSMVASSMSPQMAQVRSGVWRSSATVTSVPGSAPISAIPRPPVPGDHPVEERGDIAGKEAEEDLALHGAGLAGVADVPGGAAFPGNPATRTGLEGVAEGNGLDWPQVTNQVGRQLENHG